MKMKNKIYFVVFLPLLSLVLIWVGFSTVKENYTRDLSQVDKISGQIENTEVISKLINRSRYTTEKRILKITISNSPERLYVYKIGEEYFDLRKELHSSKEVTIYYKKLKEDKIETNIFEIKSGNKQILKHEDYKVGEYFAGFAMLILGVAFLVVSVVMVIYNQ